VAVPFQDWAIVARALVLLSEAGAQPTCECDRSTAKNAFQPVAAFVAACDKQSN